MYKVVFWSHSVLQEHVLSLSFYEALKAASVCNRLADSYMLNGKEYRRLLILREDSSTRKIEECYDGSGRALSMSVAASIADDIVQLRALPAKDTCVWSGMFFSKQDALAAISKIALSIRVNANCMFEISAPGSTSAYYDKFGGAIA